MTIQTLTQGPGTFGREAAAQKVKKNSEEKPSALKVMMRYATKSFPSVVYAPLESLGTDSFYDNLFGYTEEKMAWFDTDGSNSWNQTEFHASLYLTVKNSFDSISNGLSWLVSKETVNNSLCKGVAKASEKAFSILDLNHDGEISVLESAVGYITSDNSSQLIAEKLREGASHGSTPEHKRQEQEAEAKKILDKYPSQFDGKITDQEASGLFEEGFDKRPDMSRLILQEQMEAHRLEARYIDFQKRKATEGA